VINRKKVLAKYDGKCAYCGTPITIRTLNVDHITPKVFHGTDDIENLNPSCWECNNYKQHSDIEFLRECMRKMLNELPHQRLFKSKTKMQVAINMGAVTMSKWDGLFYFERINKPETKGGEG